METNYKGIFQSLTIILNTATLAATFVVANTPEIAAMLPPHWGVYLAQIVLVANVLLRLRTKLEVKLVPPPPPTVPPALE